MGKDRLLAFSDGVIAIIITIMALELRPPANPHPAELLGLWPIFLSYTLSFINIGIYWNNHHHMLHAAKAVNGAILWANLHFLFWLSLMPFCTAYMGQNQFAPFPTALYGLDGAACAIAYFVLQGLIIRREGRSSLLARAIGGDLKGHASLALYVLGAVGAWFLPALGCALYGLIAAIWFIPDRRIERLLAAEP